MHDLEYAYVKVEPLVWTEELISQLKEEMDYGISVLSARTWAVKDGKGYWKSKENGNATN